MMGSFRCVIRFGGAALVAGGVVMGAMAPSPAAGASGLTWSTISTPDTSSSQTNELVGVACAASADCWAVGWAGGIGGTAEQTLAEHWDGTAWSIVVTPDTGSSINHLLVAVDCVTSSDCWAVGNTSTGGVPATLAEHWNGTAWSVVATPNAGILFGVACTSSADCWAVGNSSTGGVPPGETLAEHWNGTTWSVVPTPDNTSWQFNYLYGVACVTGPDCWAVGYASDSGTASQTLAEHWNGTAWSIVATPNTGSSINDLLAVDCVRNSNCWAVGLTGNDVGVQQTLAEHWHRSAWSIVATPLGQSILSGVTCVTGGDCWAVGAGASGIEHWNRTAWSTVATPNVPLSSVACATRSDCWAVGFRTNGTVNQTVAVHGTRHHHPNRGQ
jgi:hypothetical protein